jgi:hypothetical protein
VCWDGGLEAVQKKVKVWEKVNKGLFLVVVLEEQEVAAPAAPIMSSSESSSPGSSPESAVRAVLRAAQEAKAGQGSPSVKKLQASPLDAKVCVPSYRHVCVFLRKPCPVLYRAYIWSRGGVAVPTTRLPPVHPCAQYAPTPCAHCVRWC